MELFFILVLFKYLQFSNSMYSSKCLCKTQHTFTVDAPQKKFLKNNYMTHLSQAHFSNIQSILFNCVH